MPEPGRWLARSARRCPAGSKRAFGWTSSAEGWIALATLTILEIVLGIDNIVFISILAGKLRVEDRARARKIGLSLAMFIRIALLWSITWVMRLTTPWFVTFGTEISGRDMILLVGGLFLIAKSTHEIHDKLEGEEGHGSARRRPRSSASSSRSCCSTSCSRSTR